MALRMQQHLDSEVPARDKAYRIPLEPSDPPK
jgi:hypothetical protein